MAQSFEGIIQMMRLLRNLGQPFDFDIRDDDGSITLIVGPAAKNAEVIKRSVAGQTVPAGGQASKEARKATTKKGRASRKQKSAEPESADATGDLAEKIMAALNEKENKAGLNLKDLAQAVGVRKKAKIKPAIDDLLSAKKIVKVASGRLRRADVTIKRGAPPKEDREKKGTGQGDAKTAKSSSQGAGMKTPKKRKGKASAKQLAALAKARAARAANRAKPAGKVKSAKAGKAGKKAAGKTAKPAKPAAASKKKPAAKKNTPKKAAAKPAKKTTEKKNAKKASRPAKKAAKKAEPAGAETDESGQIARSETRKEPTEAVEAASATEGVSAR